MSAEQQDIVCKPSDDVEFTLACVYYSIYQETGNSLLTDIVEQETVYFSSGESSCVRDWFLVEVVDGNLHVLVSENSTPYYRCINIQVDPEDIDMISGSYQVIQTPVESSLPE